VGVLTAKAINIPANINNCVKKLKLVLYKASKSVVPIIEDIVNIESNKNKEPSNVYKKR
jgi:hypothetical protein